MAAPIAFSLVKATPARAESDGLKIENFTIPELQTYVNGIKNPPLFNT